MPMDSFYMSRFWEQFLVCLIFINRFGIFVSIGIFLLFLNLSFLFFIFIFYFYFWLPMDSFYMNRFWEQFLVCLIFINRFGIFVSIGIFLLFLNLSFLFFIFIFYFYFWLPMDSFYMNRFWEQFLVSLIFINRFGIFVPIGIFLLFLNLWKLPFQCQ